MIASRRQCQSPISVQSAPSSLKLASLGCASIWIRTSSTTGDNSCPRSFVLGGLLYATVSVYLPALKPALPPHETFCEKRGARISRRNVASRAAGGPDLHTQRCACDGVTSRREDDHGCIANGLGEWCRIADFGYVGRARQTGNKCAVQHPRALMRNMARSDIFASEAVQTVVTARGSNCHLRGSTAGPCGSIARKLCPISAVSGAGTQSGKSHAQPHGGHMSESCLKCFLFSAPQPKTCGSFSHLPCSETPAATLIAALVINTLILFTFPPDDSACLPWQEA